MNDFRMTEHYDPLGLNFEPNGRQMKYCYPDCPRESLRNWCSTSIGTASR